MDAHDHAPHAAAPAVRDPEWNWWLGATLLFLALLLLVFALPSLRSERRDFAPVTAADRARSEQERAADLLASMAGLGTADDSVPPEVGEDIRYLIRRVAESGNTFVFNDKESSAAETAALMLERWKNAETEIYSAETLIRRVAGYKLVDRLTIRVKFPDGTDKCLADWLRDQLTERPAEH